MTSFRKIDHLSFAEAVEKPPLAPVLSCDTKKEARQRRSPQRGSAPDWSRHTRLPRSSTPSNSTVPMPKSDAGSSGTDFDQAAAEHFGVGYAPNAWDGLTKYLRAKNFTDQELITGGLAVA